MNRFKITTLALAVAAFTAGGIAQAADNELSRGDRRFLERAAQSGKLEIDASRLAVERAESQQVKDFAQKMIEEHTAVDKELRTLAQQKNVELPTDLRWGQGRAMKSLEDKEGREFDEDYVDRIAVDAHEDAVELFQDAAEDAEDADVKAFASKVLPSLQQHLQMGEALQKAVNEAGDGGVPATGGTAGADSGAATGAGPASAGATGPGTTAPGTAAGTNGTGGTGAGAGTGTDTTPGTGAGTTGGAAGGAAGGSAGGSTGGGTTGGGTGTGTGTTGGGTGGGTTGGTGSTGGSGSN